MDVRRVSVYSGQRRPNQEGGVVGTEGKDIRGCCMFILLVVIDTATVKPNLLLQLYHRGRHVSLEILDIAKNETTPALEKVSFSSTQQNIFDSSAGLKFSPKYQLESTSG